MISDSIRSFQLRNKKDEKNQVNKPLNTYLLNVPQNRFFIQFY